MIPLAVRRRESVSAASRMLEGRREALPTWLMRARRWYWRWSSFLVLAEDSDGSEGYEGGGMYSGRAATTRDGRRTMSCRFRAFKLEVLSPTVSVTSILSWYWRSRRRVLNVEVTPRPDKRSGKTFPRSRGWELREMRKSLRWKIVIS